jgi:hypothetical protein
MPLYFLGVEKIGPRILPSTDEDFTRLVSAEYEIVGLSSTALACNFPRTARTGLLPAADAFAGRITVLLAPDPAMLLPKVGTGAGSLRDTCILDAFREHSCILRSM